MHNTISVVAALLVGASVADAAEPTGSVFIQPGSESWAVMLTTTSPARAFVLPRTPDSSRHDRWTLDDASFELGRRDGRDVIRRMDGAPFESVRFTVPPTYIPLPKEYAPFAAFSDGGVLVFTGRFHFCPDECPERDGLSALSWRMTVDVPSDATSVVDGQSLTGSRVWIDTTPGTKVYVGSGKPVETDDFVAVIDPALPSHIRNALDTSMADIIDFYAERLPRPVTKSMLFASYDPYYSSGYGRQGGTLPNQVFMHFYGPVWEQGSANSADDNSAESIAFFFAHEAAHLFQSPPGIRPDDDFAWLHEGGADAMALLALTKLEAVSREFVRQFVFVAYRDCVDGLCARPLSDATKVRAYRDHYACGLLMHLAIDSAVREGSDGVKDLFDVWRTFLVDVNRQGEWRQEDFFAAARSNGAGSSVLDYLDSLWSDKLDAPGERLREALDAAAFGRDWLPRESIH